MSKIDAPRKYHVRRISRSPLLLFPMKFVDVLFAYNNKNRKRKTEKTMIHHCKLNLPNGNVNLDDSMNRTYIGICPSNICLAELIFAPQKNHKNAYFYAVENLCRRVKEIGSMK